MFLILILIMKKYLLMVSLALICTGTSVGLTSNAAKTEKVLVLDDPPATVIADLIQSESFDLIVISNHYFAIDEAVKLTAPCPVFLTSLPISISLNRSEGPVPYKQKGVLKSKYHSWYLFNPVKLC